MASIKKSARPQKNLSGFGPVKSRNNYYPVPKSRLGGSKSQSLNAASSCSSNSGGYGAEHMADTGKDYLALVVQRFDDEWVYVRVNQHCLDCVHYLPVLFDPSQKDDLLELWKRVVIDDAIPWEDNVRHETLRIVRFKMEIEDRTLSFFNNRSEVDHMIRMSALSKLTDTEARALGLVNEKAVQSLAFNPEFHREDGKLLNSLAESSSQLPLRGAMRHITPS